MQRGRRALKSFESHIEKCKNTSRFESVDPELPDFDGNEFPDLTHQQIGDRITLLQATWFCKDGSDKRVSASRKIEQNLARTELAQLRAEFQRRLENLD